MASQFELPRIVCIRCPAVATVHFVEVEAYADSVLVWCECHGEHVFACIDGEALYAHRTHHADGLVMSGLRTIPHDDLERRFVETERTLEMLSKRADALQRFMKVPA